MKKNILSFCIVLAYSYIGILPKVLSLDNKNEKNYFSFCIVLAYSYLCTRKYEKDKLVAADGSNSDFNVGES